MIGILTLEEWRQLQAVKIRRLTMSPSKLFINYSIRTAADWTNHEMLTNCLENTLRCKFVKLCTQIICWGHQGQAFLASKWLPLPLFNLSVLFVAIMRLAMSSRLLIDLFEQEKTWNACSIVRDKSDVIAHGRQ